MRRQRLVPVLLSGGAAFSPTSLTWVRRYKSDGSLFSDSAKTTPQTTDGGVVGAWDDESNTADALQAGVDGLKPLLQNAAGDLINGLPYIGFDTTDDRLIFTPVALTAYSIYYTAVLLAGEEVVLGNTALTTNYLRLTETQILSRHAGTLVTDVVATAAGLHYVSIIFNGTNVKWYIDGTLKATQAQTNALTIDAISFGGGAYYASRWVELSIANSAHDDATRINMQNYLKTRIGM